jgi:HEAT repeat protein
MLENRQNALRAMLNDPQAEVRQAAADSLDAIEAVADLDQLLQRLQQGERRERIAAAYALERVNAAKIYPPLLDALKSDDPDLRLVVVKVLGTKRHPKTLAALVKMLDDPESGIQAETARVLAGFSDRRLPEYLAPLLRWEEEIALAAIETLGALAFPEGEGPLLGALRDQRTVVRAKAAEMLGKLHV